MFGFSLDEVMAFGDSDNDIEMLSGVGTGVAMGNAKESVKLSPLIQQILTTMMVFQKP